MLLVLAFFSISKLQIRTSNLDLVDPQLSEVQRFLEFSADFGTPNSLVIVLSGGDEEARKKAVLQLAPQLRDVAGVRRVLDHVPAPPDSVLEETFLTSRDNSTFYIFVQPEDIRIEVAKVSSVVAQIENIVAQELAHFPGISGGFTGIPQYALDDQRVIQGDISYLSSISLFIIFCIFVVFFDNLLRPVLVTVCLLVSVALSLGVAGYYPSYLTLLSAPFAMMILGLGVDYGIHLSIRVEELLEEGLGHKEAIIEAVFGLGRSLATACLTTVGVFLVLLVSGFRGFRELGFIAAAGLGICLLLTFFFLPALLALFPRGFRNTKLNRKHKEEVFGPLLLFLQRKPYIFALVFITSGLLALMNQPGFDSDYLNLQPKDSDAVRLEREMIRGSDFSPYFAAFEVPSLDEADSLAAFLRSHEVVGEVRSLTDLAPPPPEGGLGLLEMDELPSSFPKLPEEFGKIDIPGDYQGVFDSKKGTFAVYAYPRNNIWEPKHEAEFIQAMKEIDAEVTGMPLVGKLMISRTKEALRITSVLAFLVLLSVLALDFRRPLPIILACITPVLSIVWMHGIMQLIGIKYNPLNIMALPIVLGIAVDDGVFILHRFIAENGDLDKTLRGTGRSVVLTSLTTLAGFGCLGFTSHLGLRTFSIILCLGVGAALLLSVVLLPRLMLICRHKLLAQ